MASFLFSFSLTDVMGRHRALTGDAVQSQGRRNHHVDRFLAGVGPFFVLQFIKGKERTPFPEQDFTSPRKLALPIVLVLLAAGALALRQPAMHRSATLDRLISNENTVDKGLDYMATHEKADFARTWPLPPAGRGEPLRLWRTQRMLTHLQPGHPAWISDEIVRYVEAYLDGTTQGYAHNRTALIPIIARLPDNETVNSMLVRHSERIRENFEDTLRYANPTQSEAIKQAEERLSRLGIIISADQVIAQFEEQYANRNPWHAWPARDALNLVSELPRTSTANEWLVEQQAYLLAALSSARSEFPETDVEAATRRLGRCRHHRSSAPGRAMNIAFIAMSGIRAWDAELLELGLTMPGFMERSQVIAALPSLGLLTLAGCTPPGHELSYHEIKELKPDLTTIQADLVAISTFTAQIPEAYAVADQLRARGMTVVMGGLHVSVLPDEALRHCDAVLIGEGEAVWPKLVTDAASGDLKRKYQAEREFDLANAPLAPIRSTRTGEVQSPYRTDLARLSAPLFVLRELHSDYPEIQTKAGGPGAERNRRHLCHLAATVSSNSPMTTACSTRPGGGSCSLSCASAAYAGSRKPTSRWGATRLFCTKLFAGRML